MFSPNPTGIFQLRYPEYHFLLFRKIVNRKPRLTSIASGTVILTLLFFFSLICQSFGETIVLQNKADYLIIGKQVSFLSDPGKSFTIEDILSDSLQLRFEQGKKDVFARPAIRSAFWVKIVLKNNSGEDSWLQLGTVAARFVDFYSPDSTGRYLNPILTGTNRGENSKVYPVNTFWLPLSKAKQQQTQTFYLRVEEEAPFELPLCIGSLQSLHSHKSLTDYMTAGFLGAILILLLYNAFLWLSTREKLYFVYVVYLVFCLIIPTAQNGYPYITRIGNANFWYDHLLFFMACANAVVGRFAIRYLNLKEEIPLAYKVISVLIISLLVMGGLNFIYPYGHMVTVFQVVLVTMFLTCLVSGYYLLLKKRRQAFYYSLGWTCMFLFSSVFILTINGFIPYTLFTRNSTYFGIISEAWLFSLALGNRINVLKKTQAITQQELLVKAKENEILMKEKNTFLEQEVNLRSKEILQQNQMVREMNIQLEEKNQKLTDQTRHLEEINANLEKFISVIAHDLRNPFNSILGLTEVLIKNIDRYDKDKIKELITAIQQSSKHTFNLLENLLEWARLQMDEIEFNTGVYNFRELLIESIATSEAQSSTKQVAIIHFVEKDFEVLCDRNMINTVLRNLISNAIKFTNPGGKIEISAERIDEMYEIRVADNGVGIPEENLGKLFSAASRLNTAGTQNEKGTGLGLVLCKEFIEKNGGTIKVKSKVGTGSTFIFNLPASEN